MSDSIRISESVPGYPVYEINHPTCSARIAKHGAHVMEWQPAGIGEPVLYLSPEAIFSNGKAIRGGIPICWPWFNAHPSDSSKPSHGIARTAVWEVGEVTENQSGVSLRFTLETDGLDASIEISLGEHLSISLETMNRSDSQAPVSGALHTYLRVGDIRQVEVEGLRGTGYLDTVGERTTHHQSSELRISGEVDRIYDASGSCSLLDPVFARRLIIGKQGSPSTVVWNPGAEKAAALGDLPDTGFTDFLCIESAISNEKAIMLAPGESHLLATTIRVESL